MKTLLKKYIQRFALVTGVVTGLGVLNGCASKVTLQGVEPAKVDQAAKIKTLSVLTFENDDYGFAQTLQHQLSRKEVNGQPFFTILERNAFERILEEQKLQYSGLVDEKTTVQIGQLVGAKGLITGSVKPPSFSYSRYYEKRTRCLDDKCKKTEEYSVRCKTMNAFMGATIKMVGVEQGRIIFSDDLSDRQSYSHCSDEEGGFPAKSELIDSMSQIIAQQFVQQISPNAVSFEVELLDEPLMKMTSQQADALEAAVELLESGRWDKAERLLADLLRQTNDRSVAAAYNLGVIKELRGEYLKAQQLYRMADSLTTQSVDEINTALRRISKRMSDRARLQEQL